MKAAQKRYTNKTVPGIYASTLQKTRRYIQNKHEKEGEEYRKYCAYHFMYLRKTDNSFIRFKNKKEKRR